jgi:hypothetical protein
MRIILTIAIIYLFFYKFIYFKLISIILIILNLFINFLLKKLNIYYKNNNFTSYFLGLNFYKMG